MRNKKGKNARHTNNNQIDWIASQVANIWPIRLYHHICACECENAYGSCNGRRLSVYCEWDKLTNECTNDIKRQPYTSKWVKKMAISLQPDLFSVAVGRCCCCHCYSEWRTKFFIILLLKFNLESVTVCSGTRSLARSFHRHSNQPCTLFCVCFLSLSEIVMWIVLFSSSSSCVPLLLHFHRLCS